MSFTGDASKASLSRAEELLRVLSYVAEPLRDDPVGLPVVTTDNQDRFFHALTTKWDQLFDLMSSDTEEDPQLPFIEAIVLFARLLQFDLALRGVWTERVREKSSQLVETLFKLLQVCLPVEPFITS